MRSQSICCGSREHGQSYTPFGTVARAENSRQSGSTSESTGEDDGILSSTERTQAAYGMCAGIAARTRSHSRWSKDPLPCDAVPGPGRKALCECFPRAHGPHDLPFYGDQTLFGNCAAKIRGGGAWCVLDPV